ncbi:uncharacterized protein LAESUDRAFT_646215 [Laetiporus sulphureus 93-53]|uniref:Small ribosomal subunit protein mS38 n=1 Tax=Laetiporus sulphureus 93-53 TaxID=1314785 RepID=A0A165FZK3_9APHY|nr:uncharacterized protein LAESUDRAFT_646215 [Laetiporus sulphureus 93-53]KZT09625.1 hypothetical protein LAESUDRAFT_646215 [Laetiporus sulphureus 93-53]
MAVLAHLLRPVPATRRAYSTFSKPGGGRFFNSSKPPKVVSGTTTTIIDANAASDASAKDQSSQQSPSTPAGSEASSALTSVLPVPSAAVSMHPGVNSHDLRLHQFFSLHRPLLLMSQPTSMIFESAATPFSIPPKATPAVSVDGLNEPPEATPEEDADAARLLARALVINRVAPSIAWENTLQKLGLDLSEGRAEEVKLAEAEFDAYMDSTKRKRRKKMKKHKLKKRRRATRSQRIKIGR